MANPLRQVSQEEYNRIALDFLEQTGKYRGAQYYQFYSRIQKELFERIEREFLQFGYTLEPGKDTSSGLLYKIVGKRKPTIKDRLNFSFLICELIYIDVDKFPGIPDVKLVVPEYLEYRLADIIDRLKNSFTAIIKTSSKDLNIKRKKSV